jgi:hypothetical protein
LGFESLEGLSQIFFGAAVLIVPSFNKHFHHVGEVYIMEDLLAYLRGVLSGQMVGSQFVPEFEYTRLNCTGFFNHLGLVVFGVFMEGQVRVLVQVFTVFVEA